MPRRAPFLAAVLVATLVVSLAAQAQVSRLQGQYQSVGTTACLTSPTGFNDSNQPIDPTQAFTNTGTVTGITTFHGNGAATFNQTSATITDTPPNQSFPASASSSSISGTSTYRVGSGGGFASTSQNVMGSVLTGPRAGQTFVIDQTSSTGHVSADNTNVEDATTQPAIETITFSDGTSQQRICVRHRVLVRIQ